MGIWRLEMKSSSNFFVIIKYSVTQCLCSLDLTLKYYNYLYQYRNPVIERFYWVNGQALRSSGGGDSDAQQKCLHIHTS